MTMWPRLPRSDDERPGVCDRFYVVKGAGAAGDQAVIFISYTKSDRDWAQWIAWVLEEEGHKVLFQDWDFVPGRNFIQGMQEGIRGASHMVVVLSDAYLESAWGETEWQAVLAMDPRQERCRLLVVRVTPCERPALLSAMVGVDLFRLAEAEARTALRKMVTSGRGKPTVAPDFPGHRRVMWREPEFPGTSRTAATAILPAGGRRAHALPDPPRNWPVLTSPRSWYRKTLKRLRPRTALIVTVVVLALAASVTTATLLGGGTGAKPEIKASLGLPRPTRIATPRTSPSPVSPSPVSSSRAPDHTSILAVAGSIPEAVAFSPDGKTIAIATTAENGGSGATDVWNSGIVKILKNPGSMGVDAVAFGPGGILAAGDVNGTTYLWNVAASRVTARLPSPGGGRVHGIVFISDKIVAIGAGSGTVYLWSLATGHIAGHLTDPAAGGIHGLALGPGGVLAVADGNSTTYLWNVTTRRVAARVTNPGNDSATAVAFSPDGTLATGDSGGTTYLWSPGSHHLIASLADPDSDGVSALAFGPGGAVLAAGDGNHTTYLWTVSPLSHHPAGLHQPQETHGVSSVAISSQGTVAVGDYSGSTFLWIGRVPAGRLA